MNKTISDSFSRLFNFLNKFGLPSLSSFNLKSILSNNAEHIPIVSELLFNYIQYVKYGKIKVLVFEDLQKEFNHLSIASFITEELQSLGYECTVNEICQPREAFLAVMYLLARYVIEGILREMVFGGRRVVVELGGTDDVDTDDSDTSHLDDWIQGQRRLEGLWRQVDCLRGLVVAKKHRLHQKCPSVPPEILHLMRSRGVRGPLGALKGTNERAEALADHLEGEGALWRWLEERAVPVTRTGTSLATTATLATVAPLAAALDALWTEARLPPATADHVETLAATNAAVFIGSLASLSRLEVALTTVSDDVTDDLLQAADARTAALHRQFDRKFDRKMRALARYTDALILDGQ